MPTLDDRRIGDLSTGELRRLVGEILDEMVDPDIGLTVKPEIIASLRQTAAEKAAGKGITTSEARRMLGLD